MSDQSKKTRIAAIGDIHVRETDAGKWKDFFAEVSKEADVLILCGDLTDTGHQIEAHILADELKYCSIPVVAVLGNHDYEHEQQDAIKRILSNEDVHILDGDSVVIENVGFAGVKGFGGGFDQFALPMWGERMNKEYVQEVVNEALKLDRALMHLDSENDNLKKVAVLHYSPIKGTILGEPDEILAFLGSSRLVEPIDARKVVAAFHGHAHHGTLEGVTLTGIKVYNVSKAVLTRNNHPKPYFLLEV